MVEVLPANVHRQERPPSPPIIGRFRLRRFPGHFGFAPEKQLGGKILFSTPGVFLLLAAAF
jgi:hypothetical protein